MITVAVNPQLEVGPARWGAAATVPRVSMTATKQRIHLVIEEPKPFENRDLELDLVRVPDGRWVARARLWQATDVGPPFFRAVSVTGGKVTIRLDFSGKSVHIRGTFSINEKLEGAFDVRRPIAR